MFADSLLILSWWVRTQQEEKKKYPGRRKRRNRSTSYAIALTRDNAQRFTNLQVSHLYKQVTVE